MKQLFSKLHGKRGESLIESLAAILVFTLSSIIFLTMVSSASRINKTVKDEYATFQAQVAAVEVVPDPADPAAPAPVALTISCDGDTDTLFVHQVVTEDGSLTAFYPTVPAGGEGS